MPEVTRSGVVLGVAEGGPHQIAEQGLAEHRKCRDLAEKWYLFPLVSGLCERWDHPIGRDLARQIRDVVRPEESRHVLIWRYVFHLTIAPKGPEAIEEYLQNTNLGRKQLAAPALDRRTVERMLGSGAPTRRQLLGRERAS